MGKNKPETKTVVTNNKRVFRIGAGIVVLGFTLTFCIAWIWFDFMPLKNRDGVSEFIRLLMIAPFAYIGYLIVVLLTQLILYLIFLLFNERSIEVSGAKKWLFYTFELAVAFLSFLAVRSDFHYEIYYLWLKYQHGR